MADSKQKGKHGLNPVAVAVTGAVVGAGIAVAGAVALRDEKNRDKVKKILNSAKDQALDYIEDVEIHLQEAKNEAQGKPDEGKKKITTAEVETKKS